MAQGNPLPGEKYLHFKNRLYQVIAVAYHSETMERFVVYQALYGDFKVYVRPYDMFVSEVDHEKYPEVIQKYRFRYVADTGADAQAEPEKKSVTETAAERRMETGRQEKENAAGSREEAKPQGTGNAAGSREEAGTQGTGNAAASRAEAGLQEEIPEGVNPWLYRFLDADSFSEKYKIVCDMRADVTDRLIDDIAVVLDVVIPEGKLSERYAQLKYCIQTRQKYEMTRLR